MTDDQRTVPPGSENGGEETPQAWGVTPPFDAAKYGAHLEDDGLTDAEKIQFLQTVWSIMAAFVDLSFRVDSVTTILESFAEASSKRESDRLQQDDHSTMSGAGAPKGANGAALRKESSHEP